MKDEKPTDYRAFFILGCSLIAVGGSLMSLFGSAFVALKKEKERLVEI